MICKNCGAQNSNESKFCESCGSELKNVSAEPLQEEAASVQEEAPVQEEAAPIQEEVAPVQEAPTEEESTYKPEAPQPKKKKGGRVLLGILAVLVAAVIVIFVGFRAQAIGFIMKLSSPEKYQGYVYALAADEIADAYGECADEMLFDGDMGGAGEFAIKLSDSAKSLIASSGLDLSSFDALTVKYDVNKKGDNFGVSLSALLNDAELISGELVMSEKTGEITLCVPALSETPVKLAGDEDSAELLAAINGMATLLPDKAMVEKLLPEYVEAILSSIEKVEKSTKELTAAGVSQKVTCLSSEITDTVAKNAVVTVAQKLKADEDIKAYITSVAEYAQSMETDLDYEDFIEELDYIIEELKDEETEGEVMLTLNTFVNSVNEIVGVELTGDAGLLIATAKSGDKVGVEISTKDTETDDAYLITFVGTEAKDVYNGDIKVTAYGDKLATVTVENFELKDNGFAGKLTLRPSSTDPENPLGMFAVTLEGKMDKDQQSVIIGAEMMGSELGTITITASEHKAEDVVLHEGAAENMEEWAMGISTDALMENVAAAGLSDIIEQIFSLGFDEDDYYYGEDEIYYDDEFFDDEYYDDEYFDDKEYDDYYDDYYEDYTDYDYGYDDGYLDGLFDGYDKTYKACYGECAKEDGSDEYMEGYDAGYEDGYEYGSTAEEGDWLLSEGTIETDDYAEETGEFGMAA